MASLKIEGLAELAKSLGSLPNRVSRSVQREALREGGELIRAQAEALAPRDPGAPDLADNIRITNGRPDDGAVGVVIGPTKNFFYGKFQEFGTSRHGAQPFMRPAFDSDAPGALKVIKSALWHALLKRGIGGSRGSSSGGGLL